jgi:hypothetical protein
MSNFDQIHNINNITHIKNFKIPNKKCYSILFYFIFLDFPIYLQSVEIYSDTFRKCCVGERGRVEECSVAPLCNKRVKTVCGCRGKRVQTKTYN